MVEGVDERGVQRLVLLRGRAPEEEGVDVERNVFVEEGNGEVGLGLRQEDVVVVGKAWADERHGQVTSN